MNFKNKTKAFTLIELLVVIAIIGILSSVVLASLQTVRERAFWSAFIQETNQIMAAIEMYVSDNGGDYMSLVKGGEWEGFYEGATSATEYLMNVVYYSLVRDGYIAYNPNYARQIVPYQNQGEYISVPPIRIFINLDGWGCPLGNNPYVIHYQRLNPIINMKPPSPWKQGVGLGMGNQWCLYPFNN